MAFINHFLYRFSRTASCKCSSKCNAVFAYAPNTAQYADVAALVAATLQPAVPVLGLTLQGFSSKDSLFAAITGNASFTQCSRVVLSVVFDEIGGGYQILIDGADVDIFATSNDAQTCRAYWGDFNLTLATACAPFESAKASTCPTMNYFKSLFVAAQVAIDSALFKTSFKPSFNAAPMQSYKQYLGEGFTKIVGPYLSVGLIYYGLAFSVSVVNEKETRVRDGKSECIQMIHARLNKSRIAGMRMMGCSSFLMASSWICTTVALQLPIVVIYTFALQISRIIYQSNGFLLFITIFFWIVSQTSQYDLLPHFLYLFHNYFVVAVTLCACSS